MKTLNRDARSLVDRARGEERLSPEHRARLRSKVMTRIAAGAAVGAATATITKTAIASTTTNATLAGAGVAAGAPGAAVVSSATGLSFVAKVGLAVVLLGGAATGATLLRSEAPSATASSSAPAMPATSADRVASSRAQADTPAGAASTDAIDGAPSSTAEAAPSAAGPSPASAPSASGGASAASLDAPKPAQSAPIDTLVDETSLVGRAQTALSQNRPDDALALLEEHAQKYPRGHLGLEARALRAMSLCALGRLDEGRTEASSLGTETPLGVRVAKACGAR